MDDAEGPQEMPEIVTLEHFPAESSPEVTHGLGGGGGDDDDDEDDDGGGSRTHEMAVAAATKAAAQAAAAAAQAAAKVVRLAGYGRQSKEKAAAVLIQSVFRGYLVRPYPSTLHFPSLFP